MTGDEGRGERDDGDEVDASDAANGHDDPTPDNHDDPTPESGPKTGRPHPEADADWRAALEAAGELTPSAVEGLLSRHGSRGRQAMEAVSERRVKRYNDFTVVVGHADEYIVEGGRCTCKDAEYNLDPEDPDQRCWHAIAVDVADALDRVDYHDMWYSEVRELL